MHKNQIPTNSGTPENQTRPAFPLFKYGYLFSHPDWVNNISYFPGYVIPYFQVYDREGKPYEHLVLFLHRCGDRARSEASTKQQVVMVNEP
jgi:hypothetical protein